MRGRRREPGQRVFCQRLHVDVVWCLDLRADAAPDLCAQQPEPDAASQRAPDTSSDLCAQSEPNAAPQRAPGAAANVDAQPTPDAQALGRADAATNAAAQPAPDAHALVSQKDAAADPSAIAAPYT